MEGCKIGKHEWLTAIGAIAALLGAASGARAEMLHSAVAPEQSADGAGRVEWAATFKPRGSAQHTRVANSREDGQAVLRGLQHDWSAMKREALEMMVTMFFIRSSYPPPTPPATTPKTPTPPDQNNTPPGDNGNPPPPEGNGEFPPGDPGAPPPPVDSPEPASFLMALLGTSLAAGYGWRRRRRLS